MKALDSSIISDGNVKILRQQNGGTDIEVAKKVSNNNNDICEVIENRENNNKQNGTSDCNDINKRNSDCNGDVEGTVKITSVFNGYSKELIDSGMINGNVDNGKPVTERGDFCDSYSNHILVTDKEAGLQNGIGDCDGSLIKNENGVNCKQSLESLDDLQLDKCRDKRTATNNGDSVPPTGHCDEDHCEPLHPEGHNNEFDNLQIDSGVESAASSWDRMAEVKEHTFNRLQEELKKAHEQLKLRDDEVTRLNRIRNDVEAELEDLTASLFQEAHNMVREANLKQVAAEKSVKESLMQIDVLTAEVAALKTLVLTSTPSMPNPHLHPQIDIKSNSEASGSGLFRSHRRSPSHFNLKYGRESSPPESPSKVPMKPSNENDVTNKGFQEVDPTVHKEFLAWKQRPIVDKSDPFIARLYREDIDCCLEFNNTALGNEVRKAIEDGSICIEAVGDKTKTQFPKKCALLESNRQCYYRMKFGENETYYSISQICRNRIAAVCDCLNYLRYIQQGLVKSSAHDMYWEVVRLRKEISLARLGLTSPSLDS